jgi:hypothetical protein
VKKHESDARRGSVAHKSPNLNGYAKSKGKKKELEGGEFKNSERGQGGGGDPPGK